MRQNKHISMMAFLSQCPLIYDLFFNFGESENGNTEIATSERAEPLKRYIDGGSLEAYDFTIIRFDKVSTLPNSDENAVSLYGIEEIMNWLKEQNKSGNYPDFGSDHVIQEVEVLQNVPTVAGWDEQGAKYQFACRVTYIHNNF